MFDWALATTAANSERLAAVELDRCGYPYRLFHRQVTRAWRGRIVRLLRPAFPRYVLVPFDRCWQALRDVWRVLGLVHFGEELARVHGSEVDRLVRRCDGGSVLPLEPVAELYSVGECVQVGGTGVLAGHEATFECTTEDGRLRVLVDMMGRMIPVDVDRCDISASAKQRERKRGKRRGHRKRESRAPQIA